MLRRIIPAWTLVGALCAVGIGARPEVVHAATTLTVTNSSGDAGVAGSLPWALARANSNKNGADTIRFAIPGSGVHEIVLRSTLYIAETVTIDATTQPGFASGRPTVRLIGNRAISSLLLSGVASGNVVHGMGFYGFGANAITLLYGSDRNQISDNWLGFSVRGGAIVRNDAGAGIGIQSSGNVIERNTVSGVYNAIVVGEAVEGRWTGRRYTDNTFRYNKIGTEPYGQSTAGLGNISDGIFFGAGASSSKVGPGNVIAGQRSTGVELLHSSNTAISIAGNFIGTNSAVTKALGNGQLGVEIRYGKGNSVSRNYISANRLGGISLEQGAGGNWVEGNVIGMNGRQWKPLGSQNVGISIAGGSNSNLVRGNAIAGHQQHGIIVADTAGTLIQTNWIGRSTAGLTVANGGFGVCFLRSSYNTVQGTAWGFNRMGNVGGAAGNTVE